MSYKDFKVVRSINIPDIVVFEPSVSWDERGNIYTSYNQDLYCQSLPDGLHFIHDKFAYSKNNVLRGLHGDTKTWKLVSCVWGEIIEVVADLRKESPTYLKWESFILQADNYKQVLIPPGFVNGYYVRSQNAVFHYKLAYQGDYIDAGDQLTIKWDDPLLNIQWPCENPILQMRDK